MLYLTSRLLGVTSSCPVHSCFEGMVRGKHHYGPHKRNFIISDAYAFVTIVTWLIVMLFCELSPHYSPIFSYEQGKQAEITFCLFFFFQPIDSLNPKGTLREAVLAWSLSGTQPSVKGDQATMIE